MVRSAAISGYADLAGKPPGTTCTSDGECASGACKPVGTGGGSICVAPCRAQTDCAQVLDEPQLSAWLMYPKVMRDFCDHVRQHGDTSILPTPVYFYGPQPQQEIAIEIDPGKTLLVALQSVASDGEAAQKVQFELNGQSRTV